MHRRKSFGDKLARELIRLAFALIFILLVITYGYTLLQDMLTGMFLDTLGPSAGR